MNKEDKLPPALQIRRRIKRLEDHLQSSLDKAHTVNDKLAVILGAAECLWEGMDKKDFYLMQNVEAIINAVDQVKSLIEGIEETLNASLSNNESAKKEIAPKKTTLVNEVNILLVDDDRDIRIILSSLIDNFGHNVLSASDGKEALDVFNSKKIDLLITDVNMPNIDGIALMKEVKKKNKELPIILITGFDKKVPMKFAEGDDTVYFLRKPFKQRELKQMMDQALK